MTLKDKQHQELIEHVIHLSQEEGLKDSEIAEKLGCSRATVNRIRGTYEIPTANLRNRKDKEVACETCEQKYYIRRKERRQRQCENCQDVPKRTAESLQENRNA